MSVSPIACRLSSYRPFEHLACERIAGLGLRFVEFAIPEDEAACAAQREQLERHGLRASSLQGRCDVGREDIADTIAAQMPAFEMFSCRLMLLSVRAGDTGFELACDRLREAGRVAAAHDITLMLETHPDLATNAAVARATIQAVDLPNVRINYDTANVYFYNHDVDGVGELRQVCDLVVGVHLKDTNGGYRDWHFPALGEGVVNFADSFALLDAAGYTGPYTLEIEGIEGEEKTESLVCERIARSVEHLRRLGRI